MPQSTRKQRAPLSAFPSPIRQSRQDFFVSGARSCPKKSRNFSDPRSSTGPAQGMTYKLLLLPGDGIGPEVMAEVERVVAWVIAQKLARIETETDLVGGCAYDAHGEAISDATIATAL